MLQIVSFLLLEGVLDLLLVKCGYLVILDILAEVGWGTPVTHNIEHFFAILTRESCESAFKRDPSKILIGVLDPLLLKYVGFYNFVIITVENCFYK